MTRYVGTTSRGIRCPIIKEGDDLSKLIPEVLFEASAQERFPIRNRDVLALTESIVARAQGNYCTIRDIRDDVKEKTGSKEAGIIFPIAMLAGTLVLGRTQKKKKT